MNGHMNVKSRNKWQGRETTHKQDTVPSGKRLGLLLLGRNVLCLSSGNSARVSG